MSARTPWATTSSRSPDRRCWRRRWRESGRTSGCPPSLSSTITPTSVAASSPPGSTSGPVVATCLDLGVTPRFIPLREPWRNGVVEHFNDVWDKSFFRTETFAGLDHLRAENMAFVEFHNAHHRYSAHGGTTPDEIWQDRLRNPLAADYQAPTRLPARGRIEVVRYIRSNRRIDLFGKRITVAEDQTHQYVTAIIKVRTRKVMVVTLDGEIIHEGDYALSRTLR